MTSFTIHTIETAPEGSRETLGKVAKAWGFVPNLQATLAESPATLAGYESLFALAGTTTLSSAERQLVFLTVSIYNECEYCAAGHTYLARASKLAEQHLQAVRDGHKIADDRLEALRNFADAVVRKRGFVGDQAVDAFIAAGFTREQVLEVVLIAAAKTISNYVNHLTHTPLETFMSDPALAWHAPSRRENAA